MLRRPTVLCIAILFLSLEIVPTPARAVVVPDGAIDKIDAIVAKGLDKTIASYAVGVMKDGRLVLARGYGYADVENGVPATAETVYRLGSITKQFTSMAIMQLAEAGKLSVDDELTKFLPDYPAQDHKVTIQHLLNHTSGIKSYTSLPNFFRTARQDLSHDEMLALFKEQPFDFSPGEKMQYNNSGYYLLGMVIEKASGQKYGDYLADHIFKPLGMHATRYGDTRPVIPRRAMAYKRERGQLINDDPISMTVPGAAGALVSNVLDLLKWHQALEAGEFISAASYEAMYRPTTLPDGKVQKYGYGWGLADMAGHRKLSHGGGINGFSTMIGRYPDDRLAVIVLANTAGAPAGGIESRIAKVMLGIEEQPIQDLPTDEALLRPLAGTYEFDGNKWTITIDEGKLYAQSGRLVVDRLKYQGNLKFASSINEEVRLTFQVVDGRCVSVEVVTPDQTLTATRTEP
ncbi:MAG TPA: serine hydrolase domain-containing protein [Pirellulales bacterium]|jgi:CubicO group peptidase (beta-lactamase class C family)